MTITKITIYFFWPYINENRWADIALKDTSNGTVLTYLMRQFSYVGQQMCMSGFECLLWISIRIKSIILWTCNWWKVKKKCCTDRMVLWFQHWISSCKIYVQIPAQTQCFLGGVGLSLSLTYHSGLLWRQKKRRTCVYNTELLGGRAV